MNLLVDVAPWSEPIAPTATGECVYRRFETEPDTLAIAVTDADGRPVGLIERNAFLVRMAAEYGRALWSRRPVSEWMQTDPLVADGDVTIVEFCGQVLKHRPSELLNGFIVTCGGRYAGVGSMLALLQASAAAAEESNARAQNALAARARFLAVMSHEIRTPLNGVLAVAEILRGKLRQPDLTPLVETIVESGGVLLRLLNDALDLSRSEAAQLTLQEEPLAVAKLLDDTAALWAPQAEIKGVALSVTYAGPDDLWVLGDAVRLRQVINNLISNALKFTSRGEVALRLTARLDNDCVRLSGAVTDSGPGLPPEQLETIFQPFQQTEDGVRRGGAGLGLAVCRQIVERMDGAIAAHNRLEGGALFRFEIPLFHVPAVPADETPEEADDVDCGVHVLIVDDNAANRLVARSLCEMFGCTHECVEDGAAAVDAAASGRFDLILMDIMMPGMDGVEATRRIRSGATTASQVPILALTANADPADAAFYRRCGMNGVVEKPIRPEHLLTAIRSVFVDEQVAGDMLDAVA